MLETVVSTCPWCGEPAELVIDPSAGSRQQYVEDCWVCCRPCVISVEIDADEIVTVDVSPE